MSSRFYDMSYPQYTVHDVSVLTGLTPQTIRYYDSIGVVVPQPARRASGCIVLRCAQSCPAQSL